MLARSGPFPVDSTALGGFRPQPANSAIPSAKRCFVQGDNMKRLIPALCLILFCTVAYAGEKEHRGLAEELIKITEGDKVMDGMKAQVSMVFHQIIAQMDIQEADKAKLEKYTKQFEDILKEDMAWAKVKDQYVDLYTSTFTEKEIKTLVDFYKSDLGKKVTEKMPELMQKSMMVVQTHMGSVVPKLESLTEEMRKEFEPPVEAEPAKSEQEAPEKK
jgi:hypothetical protein